MPRSLGEEQMRSPQGDPDDSTARVGGWRCAMRKLFAATLALMLVLVVLSKLLFGSTQTKLFAAYPPAIPTPTPIPFRTTDVVANILAANRITAPNELGDDPAVADYYLPWPGGESLYVKQGNDGSRTHQHGSKSEFAWDFAEDVDGTIEGHPIAAVADGIVRVKDDDEAGWGYYVVIEHQEPDGTPKFSLYAHLEEIDSEVQENQPISRGDPIGKLGNSGAGAGGVAHLHFQFMDAIWEGGLTAPSVRGRFEDVEDDGVPKEGEWYLSGNYRVVHQSMPFNNPFPWSWYYLFKTDDDRVIKVYLDAQFLFEKPSCAVARWVSSGSHMVTYYYEERDSGVPTVEVNGWPFVSPACAAESEDPPPPDATPGPTPTNTLPPQPTETTQPTDTPVPTATPPQSPADLKQASDLEFSPPDPSVGDTVHFWFRVRNDGGEAIEVTEIGPFGYGPEHADWDANRHGNLEIAPNGGEETIHGYRTFEQTEAGVWTVDAIHYQLVSDPEPRSYYILPPNGYRPPPPMDVVVRGPSDLRQCLDLEIHPDPPIMLGKEVRFCTDLCNYGDQPSVFKYFGPEGRDPDDRNWDAFIEGSFSVPPDSHPYTYDMFGRYYKVGEWCVDRLAVQINDDWLTRYTLPSDGHLQSFCFDVVADPDHLITFVEAIGSDREYRVVENLGVGDRYYTDRDYTILSLPAGFENLTWIMTSNEDDRQTREEFLYFALNNDADVFIAYDQRVNPLPNWMDDFENTGLFLEVSDGMASPMRIYHRHYPIGKVTLGGNLGPGSGNNDPVSNYVVMAGSVETPTPTPTPTPGTPTTTPTPTNTPTATPTPTQTPEYTDWIKLSLENPGFERGNLSGWTVRSGGWEVITFSPHDGSYSARKPGGPHPGFIFQDFDLSAWSDPISQGRGQAVIGLYSTTQHNESGGDYLILRFRQGGTELAIYERGCTRNHEWAEDWEQRPIPPGTDNIRAEFGTCNDSTRIDDTYAKIRFQLPTPTPTATTTHTSTPTSTPTDTPTATPTSTPTPTAVVWIDPPQQTAQLSEGNFTADVAITDVVNLGSFQFVLAFSPTIVHVEGAELGDFLASTGRSVSTVGPDINNEAGTVNFGAFSFGELLGPDGSGVLATISFSSQAGGESDLHLQNVQVTDIVTDTISVELQDGHVTVLGCIPGDLDCDCDVDIVDIMMVASHWNTSVGDPNYDPTCDLDSDGDIDITDIMFVAAHWGETCP